MALMMGPLLGRIASQAFSRMLMRMSNNVTNVKESEAFPRGMRCLWKAFLRLFHEKLKSKWFKPFIVKEVKPYGVIELEDPTKQRLEISPRKQEKGWEKRAASASKLTLVFLSYHNMKRICDSISCKKEGQTRKGRQERVVGFQGVPQCTEELQGTTNMAGGKQG
ncbi:hypothetical protein D0Y65_018232 [Glycine soja]|uniref:Uncharacterized protein n=1 Tax=Glycine soja TaxID=3848 RepID=A0A445JY92_GLYSO|nr:hypothetical protein D0Y65_018232 [Glycine soja]